MSPFYFTVMARFACLILWIAHTSHCQRIYHGQQNFAQADPRGNLTFSRLKSVKYEELDVERLNNLIKAIDSSWIVPRKGSREPTGSNFNHKKTCSSIYSVKPGACDQLGFGTMCFNYCHEKGHSLHFNCQDALSSSYCRENSNYDVQLMESQTDANKAKRFIHRMISRCYGTAICNHQHGLLNSSLIETTRNSQGTIDEKSSSVEESIESTSQTTINKKSLKTVSTAASLAPLKIRAQSISQQGTKRVPMWLKLIPTSTMSASSATEKLIDTTQTEEETEGVEEVDSSERVTSEETTTSVDEIAQGGSEETSNSQEIENSTETGKPSKHKSVEVSERSGVIETAKSTGDESRKNATDKPWWWYEAVRQLTRPAR